MMTSIRPENVENVFLRDLQKRFRPNQPFLIGGGEDDKAEYVYVFLDNHTEFMSYQVGKDDYTIRYVSLNKFRENTFLMDWMDDRVIPKISCICDLNTVLMVTGCTCGGA